MLHPGGEALTERLLNYCQLAPAAQVLDLGCGTGKTVEYLKIKYGLDAVGIDLDAEKIAEGKKNLPTLKLLAASAANLPFPDASFDTIIAECSLSVIEDTVSVLREINRVLLPGGKLALSDVYARNAGHLPPLFLTYERLSELLPAAGLKILVWEDHFPHLAAFTASFILEHGSTEKLWAGLTAAQNCPRAELKNKKLSYFLLIAEKIS
ncbi:MAG: class I SAM-dependent methyltransferase [Sporomusaceae bacterium]|jgi:ubiquinone/menaquinone biosynthesis C-methylase UbiE|nr:class I SAM-dependent methyltransferase [Sporomusaceae bacterium]